MMKERPKKLLNFAPFRVTYGVLAAIVMRLPRIAFFALSFYAIFWVGQQLYFKYAPADQFLDFYYSKVDDTPVGTDPLMTLCRRVASEGIKISATRTFIEYLDEKDQKGTVCAEYQFDAGIEKRETNCQPLRLKNQPQVAGTYRVHTEYEFYINGNRKSGSYDSNQYKMTAITLSTDEQINALQRQIELLQAQIDELKKREDNDATASTQPTTQHQNTAQTQQQATTQGSQAQNGNNTGNQGNSGSNGEETPPPATCIVPIFGGGLICGSDGLLRL